MAGFLSLPNFTYFEANDQGEKALFTVHFFFFRTWGFFSFFFFLKYQKMVWVGVLMGVLDNQQLRHLNVFFPYPQKKIRKEKKQFQGALLKYFFKR